MKVLLIFIVLNIVNVIIQTTKSIATIKCGKTVSAVVNAIAYGLYTIVIVYTMCDLPLYLKAVIVGVCNLVGVYIVKYLEEKKRKTKIWKIEVAIPCIYEQECNEFLKNANISYNMFATNKDNYDIFNIYSYTEKESKAVKTLVERYGAKYFVTESKAL
jgi:uncharacterized protein YebE (UPF0316 family)